MENPMRSLVFHRNCKTSKSRHKMLMHPRWGWYWQERLDDKQQLDASIIDVHHLLQKQLPSKIMYCNSCLRQKTNSYIKKWILTASISWDWTNSSMSWRPVTANSPYNKASLRTSTTIKQQWSGLESRKPNIIYHQVHHHIQPSQLCSHQNVL